MGEKNRKTSAIKGNFDVLQNIMPWYCSAATVMNRHWQIVFFWGNIKLFTSLLQLVTALSTINFSLFLRSICS